MSSKTLHGTQVNSGLLLWWPLRDQYQPGNSAQLQGHAVLDHVFKDCRPLCIIIKICRGHCSVLE